MTRPVGLILLLLCSALADAQYPPRPAQLPNPVRPVYPGRPGYPGGGYPYLNGYANPYYDGGYSSGNALFGAADLQRSTSESQVNTEQARILREKSNQAKIDTRKQAFDQMLYEKANTPTYMEELNKSKSEALTRLMNYPQRSEIVEGKTLNAMIPHLQALSTFGAQGPPVPIPQSQLSSLNVVGAGSIGGSVGMLANGGHVDWPIALQGPQQQKLDRLLPAAYEATRSSKLTAKLMKDVRDEMKTMRDVLREQLRKEEIETNSYLRTIEFYNALDNSVDALERPDARKQLSGAYAARGGNVQELVNYMTENGLRFAPASIGREDAYQAMHDAFVRYARIAQSSAGFYASNMAGTAYKK